MELEKYRPSMPIEVLHSWADDAQKEIESLRAQLAAANAEVQEQARLNGMGAEREAKLRAQLEEVTRERDEAREEVDFQVTRCCGVEEQLLATQAHAALLKDELYSCATDYFYLLGKVPNDPGLHVWIRMRKARADVVISTPINLDALHEDRARTLDAEAETWIDEDMEFEGPDVAENLKKSAAAHRAKKEGK